VVIEEVTGNFKTVDSLIFFVLSKPFFFLNKDIVNLQKWLNTQKKTDDHSLYHLTHNLFTNHYYAIIIANFRYKSFL